MKKGLLVLLGSVALVLLIGCANVANLLLVRGAARQKEVAIQAAVGASRMRLIRQLLTEQLVVALASGVAGVTLAMGLVRGLLAIMPETLPRQSQIAVDGTVLAFAMALAMLTPLIFGLWPALHVSRADLQVLLAAGGRQTGASAATRVRQALVVVEIALAVTLLVGATLLIRSFGKLQDESPGFSPEHTLVASVSVPSARYPDGTTREQFFASLLGRIRANPQVAAAGLSHSIPMVNDSVASFEIEGRPAVESTERPATNFYAISPGYFEAMRIPLLRGRGMTDEDRAQSTRVVVINETMAQRFFGAENPIGRRIKVSQGPSAWRQIVGVVGDVKQYGLSERTPNQVYEPYVQHPYMAGFSIVVRTGASDPASIVPEIRSILSALDRDVPLARVRMMDDVVSASIRPQRFSATLIGLFGGAALLLAAIGIYGVLAYAVRLRTQEFAIRMAHGADRRRILSLVLKGAAGLTLLGVALGLLSAWLLRQLLASMVFGVATADAGTYAAVATVLSAIALLASAIPALRATRIEPLEALRSQ